MTFFASANNQYCHFKKGLKSYLILFASTNRYCHIREELETQLVSSIFTFFGIDFDIANVTSLSIESPKTGYFLQHGYYYYAKIKNLTLVAYSLCEYTQKVIACIVLTNKECVKPDIWPKTLEQTENIKDMMRTTQRKEIYCWQKTNKINTNLLSLPTGR